MNQQPMKGMSRNPKEEREIFVNDPFVKKIWWWTLPFQVLLLLKYGIYHFLIVTHPILLSGREAAHALNTERWLSHGDLYQLSSLPIYTNVYGLGYTLLASPLSLIFGSTHQIHRATSALFLIGSSFLIYFLGRNRSLSKVVSLSASMLFYMLQCTSTSIAASPDLPGLFFMLLAIAIVDRNRFTWPRLLIALAVGLFAMLTKPYFVFCLPLIAFTIFLNKNKIKGISFLLLSTLTVALALAILQLKLPYSYYSVFKIHWIFSTHEWSFLKDQTTHFTILHLGLVTSALIVGVGVIFADPKRFLEIPLRIEWRTSFVPSTPLLKHKVDICVLATMCSAVVLWGKLGWHGGAFLIYFLHLLSPFLILSILMLSKLSKASNWTICFGVLLNVLALWWLAPIFPQIDVGRQLANDNLFRGEDKRVLASPHFIDELRSHKMQIYDNGETEYTIRSALKLPSMRKSELRLACEIHVQAIMRAIEQQQFDVILLSDNYMPYIDRGILSSNYRHTQSIGVDMYFGPFRSPSLYGKIPEPIQVWEPFRNEDEPD